MGGGLCAGAHRLKASLPSQLDVSVLLGPSLTPRQCPPPSAKGVADKSLFSVFVL